MSKIVFLPASAADVVVVEDDDDVEPLLSVCAGATRAQRDVKTNALVTQQRTNDDAKHTQCCNQDHFSFSVSRGLRFSFLFLPAISS